MTTLAIEICHSFAKCRCALTHIGNLIASRATAAMNILRARVKAGASSLTEKGLDHGWPSDRADSAEKLLIKTTGKSG